MNFHVFLENIVCKTDNFSLNRLLLGIADIIIIRLGIINLNNTSINHFEALLSLWQVVQIVSFEKAQQKPH